MARSIEEAGRAFAGRENDVNRVVLVTDGLETCDGDPVAAARRLKESGVKVTVDVVGFDISKSADAEGLREIAEASGGEYTDARTARDLEAFVEAENRRIQELNEAQSCLSSRGNELYSLLHRASPTARYSNMSNRSNAVYSELSNRSNADLQRADSNRVERHVQRPEPAGQRGRRRPATTPAPTSSAPIATARPRSSAGAATQLTSELRTRRDRVTSEVRALRDRVTSSIRSERDRARIENEALEGQDPPRVRGGAAPAQAALRAGQPRAARIPSSACRERSAWTARAAPPVAPPPAPLCRAGRR
ncbi:MAG: VWA domain-containing protein [Thermoleophilaceae bacterium]